MEKPRRQFLRQSGVLATGLTLLPAWSRANHPEAVNNNRCDATLKELTALNDEKIENLLARQLQQPGNRWDGGLPDQFELPNAHATTSFMVVLAAAYAADCSAFYKSAKLEKPLDRAIQCLLRVQYEDGTIDLHSTNFHSTPDTAFIVNYLSPAYVCLRRMEEAGQKGLSPFLNGLALFLQRAAKCLLAGGIHTANHRWVVSSALSRVNSFFPDPLLVARIDEWLAEGVDLDADGQYTERSASIYSPICDTMFLTIGRLLDRPELMDAVRRNLRMSLYYILPGGEVVTEVSDRQDRATMAYVKEYYYAYRYFAILDKDPEFAAVCRLIEERMPERITHFILLLLEDPIFSRPLPTGGEIPDQYFKRFAHSGIIRIRRGTTDLSIIERNPTFLSYRKGEAVLQSMRLGAAFFGKGQFEAQETEVNGNTVVMKWHLVKGYYQPLAAEHRSGQNDWEKTDRETRPKSEVQELSMTLTIQENAGKVQLLAEISGTDNVPVAWELSFRPGGTLNGVVADPLVADGYFLEKGMGSYQVGADVIRFGSGTLTHRWSQMRGTLPKQPGNSVYLTGYTPFRHELTLG